MHVYQPLTTYLRNTEGYLYQKKIAKNFKSTETETANAHIFHIFLSEDHGWNELQKKEIFSELFSVLAHLSPLGIISITATKSFGTEARLYNLNENQTPVVWSEVFDKYLVHAESIGSIFITIIDKTEN